MAPETATRLVHLVWAPLGPEPLARFMESYRRHEAGARHALLVVFNGFHAEEDLAPWRRLLTGVEHEELRLERPVLDLDAYRDAAERFPAERYCFLNSYSEPLAESWLAKLESALIQPGVGLAGATGSCGSARSWMARVAYLPSAYSSVLPDRGAAIRELTALDPEPARAAATQAPSHGLARARAGLQVLREFPVQMLRYEGFPAYHIRTNAFVVSHATLAELRLGAVHSKQDTYRLENGRSSITRRVQRKGLRTLIVDRNGAAYDHQEWHRSATFWQGDQEGLLVADNQTRYYAQGGADRRRVLSSFAWGAKADPQLHSPSVESRDTPKPSR